MLTWNMTTVCEAITDDGRTYRIHLIPGRRETPYHAILSYYDSRDRYFSHSIGFFPNAVVAKAACEADAKS
jgi:hypothetical protein